MNDSNLPPRTDVVDSAKNTFLKIARPDIYRHNPFRILEVSVTTSTREIASKMRKLELMEKLEKRRQTERGFLSLTPSPNIDTRREAYQRLNDPELRLIDELFWFWPLSDGSSADKDAISKAMAQNDISGAISIWEQRASQSSETNIAIHNLAVIYHALALDLEFAKTRQTLSQRQVQQKRAYWEQALHMWQILLKQEGFWQRINQRIRELDDPRLTTGTAYRIREQLPVVLLSINATLAVQASQKGNTHEASFHVGLMTNSHFNKTVIDDALRNALAPIRDRIKLTCANTESEAKKAPERADIAVEDLISQTVQPLFTIDVLLPDRHPIRDSAHDQVAAQVFDSTISYTNKTENWKKTLTMFEQALQIAVSEQLRQRIKTNIETINGNLEYGTCWFCKRRPSEEKAALGVKMYGDVHIDGRRVTWQHLTVPVPRCSTCKSAHSAKTKIGWFCALFGLILAIIIWASGGGWAGFIVFTACLVMGLIIGPLAVPKGIKSQGYKEQFPTIQKLLSERWKIGGRPPEAS